MDNSQAASIHETLDAWRERGADRLDPLRFHLIQAMARRADGQRGEARRRLDQRLAELVGQYGARVTDAAGAPAAQAAPPVQPAPDTLAGLPAYIEAQALADAADRRARYPELDVLDYFRATWARVSTDRQLRQSQEQVHENAGPLNSNHLVHLALSLMRDVSPGYLHQFLAYLDALSWMDQMQMASALPAKDAPRAAKSRKSTRDRSRQRDE